ncbi:unnamed protein product, partial [Chrysoparadoxa australica]
QVQQLVYRAAAAILRQAISSSQASLASFLSASRVRSLAAAFAQRLNRESANRLLYSPFLQSLAELQLQWARAAAHLNDLNGGKAASPSEACDLLSHECP